MIPQIFRSSDSGAPVIQQTNGHLTTALDKLLVTGYATQSITALTHAAGVITAAKVAHGFSTGAMVSISGAVEDEYNGRVLITIDGADAFTYAPVGDNPASSPATGAILANTATGKPGLGWQLVATDTNKRLYRPRFGTRMYLGVDDTGNAYEAKVRGFETQDTAGVSTATGTGPFPTAAQAANGCFWHKPNTAPYNWFAAGDDRRLIILLDSSAAARYNGGYFGDFDSYKTGDAYNCILIGNPITSANEDNDRLGTLAASLTTAITGHYIARSHTQAGSSIAASKLSDHTRHTALAAGSGTAGTTTHVYPEPISGGLQLARLFVSETNWALRGHLTGIWNVCHNLAAMAGVANADQFTGSDSLATKTFELRTIFSQAVGAVAIDITADADWS